MSRKKKMARKPASKKLQNQTQTVAQLEKNFKSMPTQIVAHCRKELATLKDQNKQLTAAVKQAEMLANSMKQKCETLSQAKPTASTKKQIVKAKQAFQNAQQAVKALTKQLDTVTNDTQQITFKSAKYTAFSKEWALIETELSKKLAATKTTQAKKPKSTAAKSKKADKMMDTVASQGDNEQVELITPSSETAEAIQDVETV